MSSFALWSSSSCCCELPLHDWILHDELIFFMLWYLSSCIILCIHHSWQKKHKTPYIVIVTEIQQNYKGYDEWKFKSCIINSCETIPTTITDSYKITLQIPPFIPQCQSFIIRKWHFMFRVLVSNLEIASNWWGDQLMSVCEWPNFLSKTICFPFHPLDLIWNLIFMLSFILFCCNLFPDLSLICWLHYWICSPCTNLPSCHGIN